MSSDAQTGNERQAALAARVPGQWRQRVRTGTGWACWAYAMLIVGWAVVIRTAPVGFWPAQLFLYGPRWLLGTPLLVLVPGTALARPSYLSVLAVAALVLLGPIMGTCVPWKTWVASSGNGPRLRVLTANVEGRALDTVRLGDLIADLKPDIVILQEWPDRLPSSVLWREGWHYRVVGGMLLASRYPIRDVENYDYLSLGIKGVGVRCVIDLPEDRPIAFLGLHLVTPAPGIVAILRREPHGVALFRDTLAAQWLASDAAEHWASGTLPILIAGDFNLPVESAVYRHFWSNWTNAFSTAGLGLGHTRHMRKMGTRIDHVLCGPEWRSTACWVGPDIGSDHWPVIADLEWTAPTSQHDGPRPQGK